MAKIVDTLVLNHFDLINAIGTTLHGSALTFTISGKGTWCSIPDGYIALPTGIKTNGSVYAWRAYTRSLYSSLTITAYWNFMGLDEEEYYKKKEELAEKEENEGGAESTDPDSPDSPDSPEIPDIVIPDIPELGGPEYVFDPEFIKFPDPFTGKT